VLGREIGAPIRGPDSLALERRELLKRFVGAAAGVLLRSNLLAQGAQEMEAAPWMLLVPGSFLVTTVLALVLLGEGLRDALDPHVR